MSLADSKNIGDSSTSRSCPFTAAVVVILGHYGSGKTNLALNLARDLRLDSQSLTIVDLDIVNPYFRTTDNANMLTDFGVEILGPTYGYGASNLDTPSLQPGIDSKIRDADLLNPVILDVGGDPDGARALARFMPSLKTVGFLEVIAVVNQGRPDTKTVQQNLELLAQMEAVAGIEFTALVGNTHLKEFTEPQTVVDQLPVLRGISAATGLPIALITAPRSMLSSVAGQIELLPSAERVNLYPVDQLVKTVWE